MIWVAGRSPTWVSHSLRGVAMNLKATILTYLAIDHVSFHCCKLVRKVVEAARRELIYLPKYSPDLNPIEHPWHRIKQRVRKTRNSVTQNLHDLIDSVICSICQPLPA